MLILLITFNVIVIQFYNCKVPFEKVKGLMNKCPTGTNHLNIPKEKDQNEAKACSNWSESFCCSDQTLEFIRNKDTLSLYHFSWDHCKQLSPKCQSYFEKNMCLYECAGILGSYLGTALRKGIKGTRYYNIPICQNDCENWYQACYSDLTCSTQWPVKGLVTNNEGQLVCSNLDDCKPFRQLFKNSHEFCQNIYNSKK